MRFAHEAAIRNTRPRLASSLKGDGRLAGRLGDNWLHNHEAVLRRDGTSVEVVTSYGRVVTFESLGGIWTLVGPGDVPFQLAERGAGFVLGDPRTDLLSTFDATGRLVNVEDGRGNVFTLSYAGDVLTEVSDGLGWTLTFGYDGDGRLTEVSDGARAVSFGHTGGTLSTVTDPLGQVTTYAYDAAGRLTATAARQHRPDPELRRRRPGGRPDRRRGADHDARIRGRRDRGYRPARREPPPHPQRAGRADHGHRRAGRDRDARLRRRRAAPCRDRSPGP